MAYAALSSLMHTLQQLLQPETCLVCVRFIQHLVESVYQILSALQVFLDNATEEIKDTETLNVLEKRIRYVIYKLEDCVDSSLRSIIILAEDNEVQERACEAFNEELQQVEKEVIDLLREELNKHGSKCAEAKTCSSSRRYATEQNATIVGMEDDFNTITDRLTCRIDELTVISIVGMGGIGKSTLAKKVYDDSLIRHRFDTCIWVTVSENYNERQVLLDVVSSISRNKTNESIKEMRNDQLVEIAYRDDSWNLFTERVFRKDPCPPQLEKIGRHIIRQCQGLPLSIVVVAGFLAKLDPTHYHWKKVEQNLISFFGTVSEHCQAILSLSYSYLPQYLKACFLYVGGFPEEMEISVSKLTRLWIAEQFVKARVDKRLEVVAEEYLEELVDRSLILVGRRGANGRIKTCKIHDVIRQLCTRQAQIENVVHFMDWTITDFSQGLYDQRRVMLQLNDFSRYDCFLEHGSDGITSTIRSLIFTKACSFYFSEFPGSTVSHFKLLKVLDVSAISNDFSRVIPQLVHLRYIAAGIDDPASLAKLRNLQTIILVAYEVQLPLEIWKMSAIRHIDVGWSNHIPNPLEAENHSSIGEEKLLFLNNLQNLALPSSPFLDEILTRTPNLNKLKIRVVSNTDWSVFVRCPILLQGLETLHILSTVEHDPIILSRHVFMSNIKQLTLVYTFFPWEDTVVLANLSKLEVLKANGGFWGTDWRLNSDVVFPKLKYLRLEYGDLERWEETSSDNFPVLEQLVLIWFNSLEEIPQAIGDIATLILIQVEKCGPVVEASAKKIHEEQESLGNYGLQIRTHRS
ncbi:hypothetical protein BC332_28842 [Capsicum chinense]|nr:hypothetical protein BC332_28842 [Capsicum chinense]